VYQGFVQAKKLFLLPNNSVNTIMETGATQNVVDNKTDQEDGEMTTYI